MNRHALDSLKKLRDFEKEKEEAVLKKKAEEESRARAQCDAVRDGIAAAYRSADAAPSAAGAAARDRFFREQNSHLEVVGRQLALASKARADQIANVLAARRKCDMVEHLIQEHIAMQHAEFDRSDRNRLDDFSQFQHFGKLPAPQ